jgi:hypothetical protein
MSLRTFANFITPNQTVPCWVFALNEVLSDICYKKYNYILKLPKVFHSNGFEGGNIDTLQKHFRIIKQYYPSTPKIRALEIKINEVEMCLRNHSLLYCTGIFCNKNSCDHLNCQHSLVIDGEEGGHLQCYDQYFRYKIAQNHPNIKVYMLDVESLSVRVIDGYTDPFETYRVRSNHNLPLSWSIKWNNNIIHYHPMDWDNTLKLIHPINLNLLTDVPEFVNDPLSYSMTQLLKDFERVVDKMSYETWGGSMVAVISIRPNINFNRMIVSSNEYESAKSKIRSNRRENKWRGGDVKKIVPELKKQWTNNSDDPIITNYRNRFALLMELDGKCEDFNQISDSKISPTICVDKMTSIKNMSKVEELDINDLINRSRESSEIKRADKKNEHSLTKMQDLLSVNDLTYDDLTNIIEDHKTKYLKLQNVLTSINIEGEKLRQTKTDHSRIMTTFNKDSNDGLNRIITAISYHADEVFNKFNKVVADCDPGGELSELVNHVNSKGFDELNPVLLSLNKKMKLLLQILPKIIITTKKITNVVVDHFKPIFFDLD